MAKTERVARQTRRRPPRRSDEGLLDRYRTLIIGGVAVLGVLLIGFLFLQGGARAAYECRDFLTPGPVEAVTPRPATPSPGATPSPEASPTPAATPTPGATLEPGATPTPEPSPTPEPTPVPDPTPRLGFPTSDLGRLHVPVGAPTTYGFCPPASGAHYAQAGVAPMPPAVYPATQERAPGYWMHNLEHGYVVVLYRCPSGVVGEGDCVTDAEMAQMQQFHQQAPDPPFSTCPNKTMVARFDSMTTRFAILAWSRVLLVDDFDVDEALTFAEQWMEYDPVVLPERQAC